MPTSITCTDEVTLLFLGAMRSKLEEAAGLARAAEACAREGQGGRGLEVALDIEPAVVEANHLLQGLATVRRLMREA